MVYFVYIQLHSQSWGASNAYSDIQTLSLTKYWKKILVCTLAWVMYCISSNDELFLDNEQTCRLHLQWLPVTRLMLERRRLVRVRRRFTLIQQESDGEQNSDLWYLWMNRNIWKFIKFLKIHISWAFKNKFIIRHWFLREQPFLHSLGRNKFFNLYYLEIIDSCPSLWPSGIGFHLGRNRLRVRNRLWVRFLAVSDIYPMFIEPTITWGYQWEENYLSPFEVLWVKSTMAWHKKLCYF